MVTMDERSEDEVAQEGHCEVGYTTYTPGIDTSDQSVACLLVSNNPDGQVTHQIIQLPPESVLVVSDVQNPADGVTYIQDDGGDALSSGDHINSHYQPPAIPDHNPDFYSKTCCKDCKEFFDDPSQLRDHNLIKHKDLFTCGICLRGFSTARYLKSHVESHQPKRFKCAHCGSLFSRASGLKSHVKTQHQKEETCLNCCGTKGEGHVCYKCKECTASFKTLTSFKGHECDKTKIFFCPYCGESFTRHQGLLNHMLNRENKRKFCCIVCKRRFNTQAQLRRHERVHAPEMWFKCEKCGSKYATASGFRSHNINKHSGHNPNSLPAKQRLEAPRLRKLTPHKRYRNCGIQTGSLPCYSVHSSNSSELVLESVREAQRNSSNQSNVSNEMQEGLPHLPSPCKQLGLKRTYQGAKVRKQHRFSSKKPYKDNARKLPESQRKFNNEKSALLDDRGDQTSKVGNDDSDESQEFDIACLLK